MFFVHGAHAAPATFTVTSTNDSGAGSLRDAIDQANSNGNSSDQDVIEFNIIGSGVQTITLVSALPIITEKVTIDGYTQSGASLNSAVAPNPLNNVLKIEIKANASIDNTLKFNTGSEGSIVKGLSMYDANTHQIYVDTGDITIQGNYLGVKADGITRGDNYQAPQGSGVAVNSGSGSLIGGTNPEDRNIATGHDTGIYVNSDVRVFGNFVGIGKDGITDLGSTLTFSSSGNGAIIGGPTVAKRNVISGGTTSCVLIIGSNNVVQGNYIGTDYTGAKNNNISNSIGVNLSVNSSGNLIGGTNAGEGNLIKGVRGSGVVLAQITVNAYGPLELIPSKNSILGNSISNIDTFNYPNFGNSNLGIDAFRGVDSDNPADFTPNYFEQQGLTPNDPGDTDSGPNNYINYPVLKSAQQVGNQLTVHYDLDAADSPTNRYRVEFFANDQSTIFGQGPGETYLGAAASVTPGTDLTATFTVSGENYKKSLSATTTAVDGTTTSGFGATSEFARNISIGSAVDYDADGVTDAVENQAPNNGDGNNDGIPDRLQPMVTSLEIDSTGMFETFVTTGCSDNGSVTSIDTKTFANQDAGKTYPYGLTDFRLNCSRGDTVSVTKYVFVDDQPSSYTLRKYNDITGQYRDVPGSTIENEQVGTKKALVARYAITDGGELDDDGTANGVIVDPVGLATTASLADTGVSIWVYVVTCIGLLGFGLYLGAYQRRSVLID